MGCISVHIEAVKGIGNVSAKADEMKVSASATGMKDSTGSRLLCLGQLIVEYRHLSPLPSPK